MERAYSSCRQEFLKREPGAGPQRACSPSKLINLLKGRERLRI
jgi:hypothetical protein